MRRLTPREAVVTGDLPEPARSPEGAPIVEVDMPPTTIEERKADELRAQPILVFVHTDPDACDGKCAGACQRYFDADADLFSDLEVCLASRAFRRVWMTPEDAAEEPLLRDTAEDVPRLVVLDVARDKTLVVRGKELKARRCYAKLKKIADRFYEQRLGGLVKKHLKFLDAYDKLAVQASRLQEQMTRTTNLRKIHQLEDELDDLEDERAALDRRVEDLWRLRLREL